MSSTAQHPLDPLSSGEIKTAISVVKAAHGNVYFNVVSMHEPRKAAMTKWLSARSADTKPPRVADVSVIAPGGKVGDGLVDIGSRKIVSWEWLEGVQPIVSRWLGSSVPVSWTAVLTSRSRSQWRSFSWWNLLFAKMPRS